MLSRILTLLCLVAALPACGPSYIEGSEIEATRENEEIHGLVMRYRIAVEQRDAAALRALASSDYYENGSTTDDPGDDYDFRGLQTVLEDVKSKVKAVRYEIEPTAIAVFDDKMATYDFRYKLQYLYSSGEQDRWGNVTDQNRITLRREKGVWRIVSGM